MVQPSYPHTTELPHQPPRPARNSQSKGTPQQTGADMASTDMEPAERDIDMAPSDQAPADSHANLADDGQAERPDTDAVNPGSVIRKERTPGPGVPH